MLHRSNIHLFKIPLLPELGITRVWEEAILVPGFTTHVPEEWVGGKNADRHYFWAVLVHLRQDFVVALLADVRDQRANRRNEQQQLPRTIQIADEWIGPLLEGEFISSKFPNLLISFT